MPTLDPLSDDVEELKRQVHELTNRVERLARRGAMLAESSSVLASSLDYETTLLNVVRLALPALGDFAFFDVEQTDQQVRRIAHAWEDPRRQAILDQTRWVRSTRTDINVCALSAGRCGFHPEVDDAWMQDAAGSPEHLRILRELAFCSMMTVPLVYNEHTIGALTLFFADSGRHHSEEDLWEAEQLARLAAPAVQNARLYRELTEAMVRQEQADRRKDEFLAVLGHELRNPLAPIMTALQLMELRGGASGSRERDVIKRQARHLTRLVDDLLDVSRLTRGKVELKKERVELAAVVAKAIELASPLLEQRAQNLVVQVPPTGLELEADPVRLAQVFSNLLSNAAKYAETGGHIRIEARSAPGEVEVEVKDDGIGIAPELLPRVFDLFVQGGQTLDRSQGGLGLGLALARNLVELHGGSIQAHSGGVGRGSTFTVRVPLPAPDASTLRQGKAESRPQPSAAKHRILVVDDNKDAAEMLASVLSSLGHDVMLAFEGLRALEITREFGPDLALLDIGLPAMDGYELARQLRQRYSPNELTLVAVTGYGQEADRCRSAEAGFQLHLVKPVDLETLPAVLERARASTAS